MITGLYAITDPALTTAANFSTKIAACLNGGCRVIQLRDKNRHAQTTQQAQQLRQLCNEYRALLIINDDIEIAKLCAADGVHLGRDDTPIAAARSTSAKDFIIGATCHNSLQLAHEAAASGANYLAFGRFFSSSTKPTAPPAPPEILREAKDTFSLPIVAIGGITRHNAGELIASGADAVAVCHDIFATDDPLEIERRVKQLVALF